jgi:hypothetical protein
MHALAPSAPPDSRRAAFEAELRTLSAEARQRQSVDLFARAALEGFAWAVLGGVCGKLLWDSLRPPLFLYPLALLEVFLLWDAVGCYRRARHALRREVAVLARVRQLRVALGIDPEATLQGTLPALGAAPARQP